MKKTKIICSIGPATNNKEVFKKFDINKDNCLMIGDSLSSDIKGAKNAKIDAFWIHQNINDDKGLPMGDDLLTFYTWLKRPKLV